MVQLARSVRRLWWAGAWFAAAACSPPDWPEAIGNAGTSSGGGSGSSVEAAAGSGLDGFGPTLAPVTPQPVPVSASGQGGSRPLDSGAPPGSLSADAGEPVASDPDAGAEPIEPRPDASTPVVPPVEPEPACDGALLEGVCWYLGDEGETCDEVCAPHAGFSPASAAVLGTPARGGSPEGCAAVLEALMIGFSDPLREGFRDDGRGLGCHVYEDDDDATVAWWLSSPELSSDVAIGDVRIVCGCSG